MSVFGAAAAAVEEFIPAADFAAAASGNTAYAAALSLGAEASAASILAGPALVLGAGTLGWLTGQQILKWLNRPETLPPLRRPFTGGGQAGRVYTIALTCITPEFGTQHVTVNRTGPIGPPVVTTYYAGGRTLHKAYFDTGDGPYVQVENATDTTTLTIDSVIPVDGQPDTSRSPALDFPAVGLPGTGLTYPGEIAVPGAASLPVPSEVIPSDYNNPDVKEDERVAPGVVVRQPTLGQELQFTPTGVHIRRYNPGPNTEIPPKVAIPPGLNTKRTDEKCPCPTVDTTEIIKRLKDLARCDRCKKFTLTTQAIPHGNSGRVSGTENPIYKVEIELTQSPINVSKQRSTAPAPDVVFYGWYAFEVGGVTGERKPLHFGSEVLLAPENANGFVFQTYNLCEAAALVYIHVPMPPPEPPV